MLVGSYPTEVQAAIAHDDATRQALLAPVAVPLASSSSTTALTTATSTVSSSPPGSAAAAAAVTPAPPPPPPREAAVTPTYNFASDGEARERLDAVAVFEAGLEVDGITEVDPSLVLVATTAVVKDGKVRCKIAGGGGGGEEAAVVGGGGDKAPPGVPDNSEGALSSQAGSGNVSVGGSAELVIGASAEEAERGGLKQGRLQGKPGDPAEEVVGASGVGDNGGVSGGRGELANGTPMDVDGESEGGVSVNGGGVHGAGGDGGRGLARYDRFACFVV